MPGVHSPNPPVTKVLPPPSVEEALSQVPGPGKGVMSSPLPARSVRLPFIVLFLIVVSPSPSLSIPVPRLFFTVLPSITLESEFPSRSIPSPSFLVAVFLISVFVSEPLSSILKPSLAFPMALLFLTVLESLSPLSLKPSLPLSLAVLISMSVLLRLTPPPSSLRRKRGFHPSSQPPGSGQNSLAVMRQGRLRLRRNYPFNVKAGQP